MKRRTFNRGARERGSVAGAGGAQQADRVRRVGVLMGGDENDPERKARLSALKGLRTWVGRMAAAYIWTFVGPALTAIGYERSRRSWLACTPTSS
jgi:hypothetical protein